MVPGTGRECLSHKNRYLRAILSITRRPGVVRRTGTGCLRVSTWGVEGMGRARSSGTMGRLLRANGRRVRRMGTGCGGLPGETTTRGLGRMVGRMARAITAMREDPPTEATLLTFLSMVGVSRPSPTVINTKAFTKKASHRAMASTSGPTETCTKGSFLTVRGRGRAS